MGLFGGRDHMAAGVFYGGEWFAGSELIATGWTVLAGLAWGHYLQVGRGAIWLPQDADEAADGPGYVPASKPSLLTDHSPVMRSLRNNLAKYKPEREFVILFSGARDLKAYHAGKVSDFEGVLRPAKGQLPPPQAYQRLLEADTGGENLLNLFDRQVSAAAKLDEERRAYGLAPRDSPNQEQLRESVEHLAAMHRLWRDGRIDIARHGGVTEDSVFYTMADLHGHWVSVAAHAWRGYQLVGRGLWSLNCVSRVPAYIPFAGRKVPDYVPMEAAYYCQNYEPSTDVVIALLDVNRDGRLEASASFWVRPPDTWTAPPAAWHGLDSAMRSRIEHAIEPLLGLSPDTV